MRNKSQASTTLHELHYYIQASLGWEAFHLHKFYTYDERTITLMQLIHRNNKGIFYEYDFGDNWQIDIKIEALKGAKKALKPVCTFIGARAAPPEDCGGIMGYYQILRIM